jgi:hypothetical protein
VKSLFLGLLLLGSTYTLRAHADAAVIQPRAAHAVAGNATGESSADDVDCLKGVDQKLASLEDYSVVYVNANQTRTVLKYRRPSTKIEAPVQVHLLARQGN